MRLLHGILACASFGPILSIAPGCTVPIIAEMLAGDDEAKAYADNGLSFSHPASWEIETERDDSSGFALVIVTIEGPESALAMVQQFRPKIELDPNDFMKELTQQMRVETESQVGGLVDYAQGDTRPITRSILGKERTGLESHFSVSLLGQDVPHTAQLFPIELDDRLVLVFLQVADEDRAARTPGFDMIVDSLAVQ